MNVSIGHDCFFTLDTAEYLRYNYLVHKIHNANPALVPPFQAMDMMLGNAARALGMEKEIGSLAVGKKADILLIDPDSPSPVLPSSVMSYFTMTFQGSHVDTVLVDGKVVIDGRISTTVDEGEVSQSLCRTVRRSLEKKRDRGVTMAVDLTTRFCGIEFKNPLIVPAGVHGRSGEVMREISAHGPAAICTKTIVSRPARDVLPCFSQVPTGMVNSVFGSDRSSEYWFAEGIAEAKKGESLVIANLAGFTPEEAGDLAARAEQAGADMIMLPLTAPIWEKSCQRCFRGCRTRNRN